MSGISENDKILEELKSLKTAISPMISIMQEFRDLKIKNKVSVESHTSLIGLLTASIKDEVMRDVSALNFGIKDSLTDISNRIENNQQEVYAKFEYFQNGLLENDSKTSEINESIGHIRSHLNKFYDKFDEFKKELDVKSSLDDTNELKQKVKLFAFKEDLENLKVDLFEKASNNSVDKIGKRLTNFEEVIKKYVEKKNLEDIKNELKLQVEAYIDLNCLLREEFMNFKDVYHGNRQRIEDDFKGLVHKIDNANKNLKESINETKMKITKKPWKKDIDRIDKEMQQYLKYTDFKNLENIVFPSLQKFERQVEGFSGKISEFEVIVQRYDEILLEKASKDDIKFLKGQMPLFVSHAEFEETNAKVRTRICSIENDMETVESFTKTLEALIVALSSKFDFLKKENKEAGNVAIVLAGLKEKLLEKADKVDFHAMVDSMGKKEQLEKVSDKVDVIQKQIELSTILNHTLCRTLINSGESSSTLIKQRQDIYRKMTGLVGWVNGEEPRVKSSIPWRGTPSVGQEIYLYKEDSLKNLPRTSRNQTARIKIRPKRFTPKLDFNSLGIPNLLGNSVM